MDQLETHAQTFDRLVEARGIIEGLLATIERANTSRQRLETHVANLEQELGALRKMVSHVTTDGRVVSL